MTYRDIPDIAKRYKSKRWSKLRKQKLSINPFCEECELKGIYTPTYIIHHKEWITDKNYIDDNIFFNIDNLESVCLECHNKIHFGEEEEIMFDDEGNVILFSPNNTPPIR